MVQDFYPYKTQNWTFEGYARIKTNLFYFLTKKFQIWLNKYIENYEIIYGAK